MTEMNKHIGLIGLALLVFGGMFSFFALNPVKMPCEYPCIEAAAAPYIMLIFISAPMFLVGLILAIISVFLPPKPQKQAEKVTE
jgi:hypothetical protein